jgi:DNA-directed RNA polymerase subunit RPC12/RpoP
MCKPNIDWKCWACGKELPPMGQAMPDWNEDTEDGVELVCPDCEWAGNQWVIV